MPAAFVGHGNPMNALERNRYTDAWRAFADALPRPRAVLVVSAHWFVNASAVTAMAAPRTIHDFFGFPPELFAVEYPAPGCPDLAERVADLAQPTWVGLDHDSWGLDHGAWSVLVHMFPAFDTPVVQLSVNASQPLDYHVDLGARLAPLRREGVLVLASGNVVHNLHALDPHLHDGAADWAQRFDEAVREVMGTDPVSVARLADHPDFLLAAPTPDHFLPLLYLAGLAGAAGRPAEVLVSGYAYGSLSMTAYTLDMVEVARQERRAELGSPDLPSAPPDEINL